MKLRTSNLYDSILTFKDNVDLNFQEIETYINNLDNIFGLNAGSLQINNLTINPNNINVISLNNNGSASIKGDLEVGNEITTNKLKINEKIELVGDLQLKGANSNFDITGNLKIGGNFILNDLNNNDGFVDACNRSYFLGLNQTIQNTLSNDTGFLLTAGRNIILLNWSNYKIDDSEKNISKILLESAAEDGQILDIIAIIPNSGDFYILKDTLEFPDKLSASIGIKFNKSYQTVRLISYNKNWVILNLEGCIIE